MRLYHVTGAETAQSILASGFREADSGNVVGGRPWRGAWLTDDPIAVHAKRWFFGSSGDAWVCATLDVDEAAIAVYEDPLVPAQGAWSGAPIVGENFRQWLVPVDYLREHVVRLEILPRGCGAALRQDLARDRKPLPPYAVQLEEWNKRHGV